MAGRKKIQDGLHKGEDLLSFSSAKNWFQSLEESAVSRGKNLTSAAKRVRFGKLYEYTMKGTINPDSLLEEAKTDINAAMKRLTDYFNQVQKEKGVDWNSACTSLSFLRGFYTHNGITFPKRFKIPKRRVSAVSKRDSKTEIYSYNEETDEIIFHNGTLQHFISNLNFRDQVIALSLLSTGADTADLLKLNVGFVKDGKGEISKVKRFLWHDNREKDGIEFKVYFSEEATQFLKRFVEQERAEAKDSEPLFVKEDGQRLPAHALAMNFRLAAQKMGFTVDEESNPFRPKRFRHLFRTACGNAHIDAGFTMAMMGHASDISGSYLEKSDGLFLKEYVRAEPFVTVFGVSKNGLTDLTEEVQRLADWKTEAEHQITEKTEKINNLYSRNEELEAKMNGVESEITEIKEALKKWLTQRNKK
jgi:integrase